MLEEGTVLARKYRLTKPAGFGGMAQLWSAVNESTGAEICIKVFIAGDADDEAVARFRREATAAARLSHRAIVRVFDLVELTAKGDISTGPSPYALAITMELLKGETLGDLLMKKGKLSVDEALDVILPVCSALAHAHRANIVHRDVKPENIFLSRDPDGHVEPKVLDFGVSKMRGAELGPLTFEGVMLGTPTFMSPEQARGARDVNARSDVFSVGILLYLMLTGKNPFESNRFHETVKNILEKQPPRIEGLPGPIWNVIEKALTKEAARRYADAGELGRALRAVSGRASAAESGAVLAASPSPPDSAKDVAAVDPSSVKLLVKPLGGDSHITVPPASQGEDEAPAPAMTDSANEDDDVPIDSSDERRALLARARRASARGAAAVEATESSRADAIAANRLRAAAEARQRAIRIVGGVLGVAIVIMIAAFLRSPGGSTSDGTRGVGATGTPPTSTPPATSESAPPAASTATAPPAPSAAPSASAAPTAAIDTTADAGAAPAAPASAAAPATGPAPTAAAPNAPATAQPAAPATQLDTPSSSGKPATTAPTAPPAPASAPPPAVTVTATATAVAPTAPPPAATHAPPPPAPPAASKDPSIVRDPGF